MQSDLKTLEQLLQLPLFDSVSHASNPAKLLAFVSAQGSDEYGILVRIDSQPGILKKLAYLLSAARRLRILSQSLQQQGSIIEGRFAVYPDINDPVTIYQLGSHAEQYTNNKVLPVFSRGINGVLRKFIMRLVRFHPSVAGLILVARKA